MVSERFFHLLENITDTQKSTQRGRLKTAALARQGCKPSVWPWEAAESRRGLFNLTRALGNEIQTPAPEPHIRGYLPDAITRSRRCGGKLNAVCQASSLDSAACFIQTEFASTSDPGQASLHLCASVS